jgi:transcriptional regulator with XRE-family HTH domain
METEGDVEIVTSGAMKASGYKPLTLDGETIKRLRRKRGLTQSELASKLDRHRGTITHWEGDRQHPRDPETIARLVNVLEPEPEPAEKTYILPISKKRGLVLVNGLVIRNPWGYPPTVYFAEQTEIPARV